MHAGNDIIYFSHYCAVILRSAFICADCQHAINQ